MNARFNPTALILWSLIGCLTCHAQDEELPNAGSIAIEIASENLESIKSVLERLEGGIEALEFEVAPEDNSIIIHASLDTPYAIVQQSIELIQRLDELGSGRSFEPTSKLRQAYVRAEQEGDLEKLEQVKEKLTATVDAQFMQRIKDQQQQLELARLKLRATQERIQERLAHHDAIVEQRVRELLSQDVSTELALPIERENQTADPAEGTSTGIFEGLIGGVPATDSAIDALHRVKLEAMVGMQFTERADFRGNIISIQVQDDGIAYESGLRSGDQLTGLGGWRMDSMADVGSVAKKIGQGRLESPLDIHVRRDGEDFFTRLAVTDSVLGREQRDRERVDELVREAIASLAEKERQKLQQELEALEPKTPQDQERLRISIDRLDRLIKLSEEKLNALYDLDR